jgi:RNA polymerase sigma factor (sigma-70 family)
MTAAEKSDQFLAVVAANKGILYKVANSYCRDPDDREDLVQEMVLQVWRSFDRYNEQYKQSTWMYRIALNVAISFYRKANRRKQVHHPLSASILSYVEPSETAETELQINRLHAFIAELKEIDKALMLLYLEEKSYKEIAEIMGLSETNVATKLSRIKAALKLKFSELNNH